MTAFGEILPNHDNHARLDRDKKDKHGLPLLVVDAVVRENERKMEKDMMNDAAEMLEAAGYKNVTVKSDSYNVGQQHPRERHGAHGHGSEEVGAEQVQPGARLQERVRHRRLVHALVRLPEPLAHLHGVHGARGRATRSKNSRRATYESPETPEMMQRRELLRRAAWMLGGAISAPAALAILQGCSAQGAGATPRRAGAASS